ELHGIRALRRGCDGVSARNALRKTEIDPLSRLETEVVIGERNGQLHNRRRELFDLSNGRVVFRHRAKRLPHPSLREFLNFPDNAVALESAQAIDEELPVQMIDLMRQRSSHQTLAPHLARLAV